MLLRRMRHACRKVVITCVAMMIIILVRPLVTVLVDTINGVPNKTASVSAVDTILRIRAATDQCIRMETMPRRAAKRTAHHAMLVEFVIIHQ